MFDLRPPSEAEQQKEKKDLAAFWAELPEEVVEDAACALADWLPVLLQDVVRVGEGRGVEHTQGCLQLGCGG